MGLAVANEARYDDAVRCLFPQGEYWDTQFADPQSDVNLFCKVKSAEIIKLRKRMCDLFAESSCQSAVETINDWERVLLGHLNMQLTLEERREILIKKNTSLINRALIAEIAQRYGLTLIDIIFPFKPSFFGFSKFGCSIFSRPAFYSAFYIITKFQNEELRAEAGRRVAKLIKNSTFGSGCFGFGQFLGRSFFIKDYSSRIFSGIKILNDFEIAVNNRLIASNINYFLYKF
ncbi:MAG: YmfQ family protein [Treponema sp.]|jgi:hypothetical protein|nr:YmfQ family protein [Treponema sp.]